MLNGEQLVKDFGTKSGPVCENPDCCLMHRGLSKVQFLCVCGFWHDLADHPKASHYPEGKPKNPPTVAADGSKSIGVHCCDRSFETAAEAERHELEHEAMKPKPWFPATGWVGEGTPQNARVICRVEGYPYGDTVARVNLIAAAPDLYKQLKALVVQIEASRVLVVPPGVKAAIAKAERRA